MLRRERCRLQDERDSFVMRDIEHVEKQGLPPRERNADVPEHASNSTIWMGVIAVFAVVALLTFGTSHVNDTVASNPVPNTQPGMTTGAAPAAPSKLVQ
jgi:hypothetical protein